MDFIADQFDCLFTAHCLSHRGKGFVPEDAYYPAAESLVNAGWLRREVRRVPETEVSFHWTEQAEAALVFGAAGEPVN